MSWTSEFEPSPPRPNLEPDDFSGDGFEVVGLDGEDDAGLAADGPTDDGPAEEYESAVSQEDADLDGDGPLDPSIFDGLFDDLGDDNPSAGSEQIAEDGLSADVDLFEHEDTSAERSLTDDDITDYGITDHDITDHDVTSQNVSDHGGIDHDIADQRFDDAHVNDSPFYEESPVDAEASAENLLANQTFDDQAVGEHQFSEPADHEQHLETQIIDAQAVDGTGIYIDNSANPSVVDAVDHTVQPPVEEYEQPADFDAGEGFVYEEPSPADDELAQLDSQFADANNFEHVDVPTDDQNGVVATSITLDPAVTPFDPDAVQGGDGQHVAGGDTMFFQTPPPDELPPAGTGLFEPMAERSMPDVGYPQHMGGGQQLAEPPPIYPDVHDDVHYPESGASHVVSYQPPAERRRWPAFAIATVVGAFLGIGGALLLFQLIQFSDDPSDGDVAAQTPEGPTQTTEAQQTTDQISTTAESPADTTTMSLSNLAATGRFELHTISFAPGTVELTASSAALLDEMAEVMIERPDQPVSVSVRTFSESTPAANRELSGRQGQAIVEHLLTKGAPIDSLLVHGLGAARLDLSQPVQNFVVVNTDLGTSGLQTMLDEMSPFAIGIDPVTNQLRPESIEPLNLLGEALGANSNATISLAAYSYGEPEEIRNRELATVAAEAAAAFLVTNYEIDRQRVSTLAPGQALYAAGATVGNHVSLQWGGAAGVTNQLARLTGGEVVFGPGSAFLTPETVEVLDRLVGIMGDTGLTVVIQVHVATEGTDEANTRLSDLQAQVIADYLTENGLLEQQVRAYGGGNLRQFQGADQANIIVVTALP